MITLQGMLLTCHDHTPRYIIKMFHWILLHVDIKINKGG